MASFLRAAAASDGRVPRALEREAEWAAVRARLDDLGGWSPAGVQRPKADRGGLLVFTGPAGVGKTTVLAEVRRLAAERECVALFARGGERERAVAFHVVRQLLQPLLASYPEAERRELLGAWYDIIGPCVGLCPVEDGAAPDPQGVRDGLDWVLINVAVQRGPLVLVLDDAHWADPESLAWLGGFTSRLDELPVLMVIACRTEDHPTAAAETADVTELDELVAGSGARPYRLAPLSPGAVAELVRADMGAEAEDAFCQGVWQATEGNPFRTLELIAKAKGQELSPTRENTGLLPSMAAATDESVVARLERLDSSAVRLARAAAVLGAEASPSLVMSIAGMGPAEAADAAERLCAARLVKDTPNLELAHPLIATAIYRSIPAATRVALHGKAAWDLIESGQGAAAAARHLMEIHPEDDPWVVGQLREAAMEYLRTGAPDAARRCLERALREPPLPELRATLLYELGCPALWHDPATAVNNLRSALEEAGPDGALRQGIVIRLARALAYCDRMPEAVGLLEEEARATTDAPTRLRLHTEHFMMAAFSSQDQDTPTHSRRLAKLAERLTGHDQTERYVFGLRAWDAMLRGEPAAVVLDYAERALADGMNWTDEQWGFEVPALVGLTFLYCDRPDRAEELFTIGVAEFERQGQRGVPLAFGYSFLGYIHFRAGRLTDAEDFARLGLRLAGRAAPGAPVHWYAVGSLIEILLARGKTEAAEDLAARHDFGRPFPSAVTIPDAQSVGAELLLARGRVKEAAEELTEVGRRLDARGVHNPSWCPWMLKLALAVHAEDPDRARELAREAVRRAERFGTDAAVGSTLCVAARVQEPPEAIALLRRAVDHLERSSAAHLLAVAQVELGAALRRDGRAAQAAAQLYQGVQGAVRCGAEELVRRASDELVAAGLPPRRAGTWGA
ncbi:AAA family ATPase [Streptomyces sp. SAJ15]|uniref:ATP-binding protein n=1 Tax=Streptomyces sp. SAJ15 TaxID=2011095 RepID=UPI001186DB59|nr:AAA family ATPase [Streptomyces sp. SAJ15]TVL93773.1 hypothetical protein CD790_01610 [Streptomyces sp. SAJ15]